MDGSTMRRQSRELENVDGRVRYLFSWVGLPEDAFLPESYDHSGFRIDRMRWLRRLIHN